MKGSALVTVACRNTPAHVYDVTVLIGDDAAPIPPRYCAFCAPPAKDSEVGRASKVGCGGGIFIGQFRATQREDHYAPIPDRVPVSG